jgi:hypothetical protein
MALSPRRVIVMSRKERQLLLAVPGEQISLPDEVARKTAQAMGALLLQILRAQEIKAREEANHDRRR